MISALRRRHRLMIPGLAIASLAIFAGALAKRAPAPSHEGFPISGNNVSGEAVLLAVDSVMVGGALLEVRLIGYEDGNGLRLEPLAGAAAEPDVLIYWRRARSGEPDPEDAYLLGALAGSRAQWIPLAAQIRGGELFFYSLARQQVIGTGWRLPPADADGSR